MKNIKSYFFIVLTLFLFFSCKKEENKVYYEGGTAPVLNVSSTTALTLTDANKDKTAIAFSWTNPNYKFTTGVSSHDVTYHLEVDTVGANFTNPAKQELVISKDLGVVFTQKSLNAILLKMGLAEDKPHVMEFRLKSTLTNNSLPLYSNVIKITITPYLDVAVPLPPTDELYITGSAMPSDWTNTPPASQKATPVASSFTSSGHPTAYTITVDLTPGKQYKFLSTQGQWQPQYGGKNANGGEIGYNMGSGSDPDAIPTPDVAGKYLVTLNFKTGVYSVVKQ